MKLINIALSLLLATPAWATAKYTSVKKSIDGNLDGFGEQAEVAKIKHELVEHESHLRGSYDEETLIAVDQNRNNARRADEWLTEHNNARETYQTGQPRMLKWNTDLKRKAQSYAKKLTIDCVNRIPPAGSELLDLGFNIAMKQGHSDFQAPADVMKLWNNKLYNGWPGNKEMSQVLWKATEYVGCAQAASAKEATKTCTSTVCFYARAGNCGMGGMNSWADHEKKINEGPACGPCPADRPNCSKCNTKVNGEFVPC